MHSIVFALWSNYLLIDHTCHTLRTDTDIYTASDILSSTLNLKYIGI